MPMHATVAQSFNLCDTTGEQADLPLGSEAIINLQFTFASLELFIILLIVPLS